MIVCEQRSTMELLKISAMHSDKFRFKTIKFKKRTIGKELQCIFYIRTYISRFVIKCVKLLAINAITEDKQALAFEQYNGNRGLKFYFETFSKHLMCLEDYTMYGINCERTSAASLLFEDI